VALILGWLGGWVVQALLRDAFFDANLLTVLAPMTGLIFWVFTNYMITDPGTSPTKPRNQVIFGFSTAILYGVITVMHIVYGIFIALTIVCVIRGLIHAVPNWTDAYRQRRARSAVVAEPAREGVPA
jgi:hypothetical protein